MPRKPKDGSLTQPKADQPKIDPSLETLDIQYVPVDSLTPNEYNPNRQSDHEFELLCRSIEEDGFTQPILVNKESNQIVDGEHRWRAMKALGYTEVPVCYTNMTLAQMKIATLRHNRARGNEDIQRAADVIRELQEMGAVEWAADSLILDNSDLNMLLQIPTAELNLRSDEMDYDATIDTLKQEEALKQIKAEEEQQMAARDSNKLTYQMTYLSEEALIVRTIIGQDHATGILNLCKKAQSLGLV